MMKVIGSILGVTALLGVFFGVHEWQENRYALKSAWAQTDKKVDYHIINQQREMLEYRVEKKEADYKAAPSKDKAELLKDLKQRLAEKEKELKKLEEKK